jgi:hypothetical protein
MFLKNQPQRCGFKCGLNRKEDLGPMGSLGLYKRELESKFLYFSFHYSTPKFLSFYFLV